MFRISFTRAGQARMNIRRGALLPCLLMVLLLAGCTPLLNPGPPPVRMQLNPDMPQKAARTLNSQLTVALPQAARDIDTDRIALLFGGREVRYLSGTRWTTNVPNLLQRNIIDALNASGGLHGVADESSGISADIRLESYIRQFCLRYDAEGALPTAWFSVSLKLVDQRNGRLLGSTQIDAEVPARASDTLSLADAMEEALSKGLAGVTDWVLGRM